MFTIEKLSENFHPKYKLKREQFEVIISQPRLTDMHELFNILLEKIDRPYGNHKIGTKIVINGVKTVCIEFREATRLSSNVILNRIAAMMQSEQNNFELKSMNVTFTYFSIK